MQEKKSQRDAGKRGFSNNVYKSCARVYAATQMSHGEVAPGAMNIQYCSKAPNPVVSSIHNVKPHDPACNINVGACELRSSTIDNELNKPN